MIETGLVISMERSTYPHGFDCIVSIFDRFTGIPLDLVRKEKLVDDVNAVVLDSERCHHFGRHGRRRGISRLNSSHNGELESDRGVYVLGLCNGNIQSASE